MSGAGIRESATGSEARLLRYTGALAALVDAELATLHDRTTGVESAVRERVAGIVAAVRQDGDSALRALAREYDGVELTLLEVPRQACDAALRTIDPALRAALQRAARNLRAAHAAQLPTGVEVETEPGVMVGRRPDPLRRVGVYAPGGRAAYASSVLMGAVPARVAGVEEVILCSPPEPSGRPSEVVLAAAAVGGVDRVFALGGAGAIAAMAFGTTTIPRVERIVGPGNAYVAEAKVQLAAVVASDTPAGPSELLVLADFSADPIGVAREMLAQAEHDPDAAVLAVIVGEEVASEVAAALGRLLPQQPRAAIIAQALRAGGGVLVAQDYDRAIEFMNAYAAEHVLLMVHEVEQEAILARLRNAGAVFLGESSSVAFGDYLTGANHVLPTGGLARAASGLSTLEFFRWTSYQRVTRTAAAALAEDVALLAESEGLPGHAAAARHWLRHDASLLAAEGS